MFIRICLERNYEYYFLIQDSFGDGREMECIRFKLIFARQKSIPGIELIFPEKPLLDTKYF